MTESKKKTRGNTSNLTPGNPGNSGGKKGRSGRKPKETLDFLQKGVQRPKARAAFNKRLDEGDLKAWELVLRYTQTPGSLIKIEGGDTPLKFTLTFHSTGGE